jgi:hypothetical protein
MDAKDLLANAAGSWSGEWKLWMRPDALDAQSPSRATISSELRGRTLLLRHDWRFGEDDHEGLALLGLDDEGIFQMSWTETFGYAGGIFHCLSESSETSVLGHYGPVDATWGWRTEFDMPTNDELVMRAFNIMPGRDPYLATEGRWTREAG